MRSAEGNYTRYVLNFDLIETLDRFRFGDFSAVDIHAYLQGKKLEMSWYNGLYQVEI